MPTYLSPGVYVEEVEAGSRPIEGVGTAVAAFVGFAAAGPFDAPTLVSNWTQYTKTFGDFVDGCYEPADDGSPSWVRDPDADENIGGEYLVDLTSRPTTYLGKRRRETPIPVRPGEERPERPVEAPEEPEPEQVSGPEVLCGRCGIVNVMPRQLCRVCGQPFVPPLPPMRLSWWRRAWEKTSRRRVYPVGTRRSVHPAGRLLRVVVLIGLAAMTIAGVRGAQTGTLGRGTEAIRDRIAKPEPVAILGATASSSLGDAQPGRAWDGTTDLYWAPDGAAEGAWLEFRFQQPVRLLYVVVRSGVSDNKQKFLESGRPQRLRFVAKAGEKQVGVRVFSVADEPGPHKWDLKASQVTKVTVTVESVYQGKEPIISCAIGEIEFFAWP